MVVEKKEDLKANGAEEKNKNDIYFSICNSVLKLEFIKGHLNWKLSDVARDANVTRSLIYYYFGKEKEALLREACRFMLSFIYTEEFMESEDPYQRFIDNREKIKKMPYLLIHFFMQRLLDTELGKEIRRAEEEHFARQIEKYPHNNIDDIHRIYAVQLGILYYQNFTDQEVESIMRPIFFKIK